jgi:hypothetical protein
MVSRKDNNGKGDDVWALWAGICMLEGIIIVEVYELRSKAHERGVAYNLLTLQAGMTFTVFSNFTRHYISCIGNGMFPMHARLPSAFPTPSNADIARQGPYPC